MSQTCYEIYGVQIDPGESTFLELDAEIGQCSNNGDVGYLRAGRYDERMTFLALRWREVPLGEYTFHSGERATATAARRHEWNIKLRRAAYERGYVVVEGPGWFTVPEEG